jgi:cyclohexyl-isocyanide hydratase
MLPLFGAIPDKSRVARDGNIITGGGVTAGIDFALVIAAELMGEAFAQAVQLNLEYAPAPPFNAGRPETAPADGLERVKTRMAEVLPGRRKGVQAAAARIRIAVAGRNSMSALWIWRADSRAR